MAAVEAWFLGGPVDGRLMPVEVSVDGSPPAVVKLPQTGFYVGPSEFPRPAVEHVYVLADRLDDVEVYQYRQTAPEATDRQPRPAERLFCGCSLVDHCYAGRHLCISKYRYLR